MKEEESFEKCVEHCKQHYQKTGSLIVQNNDTTEQEKTKPIQVRIRQI